MRKWWIIISGVLALLLLLILTMPLMMGFWVQKRYPQLIQEFNTPHVTFELVSFKRGWFHSVADVQITLHSAETSLSGESFPLAKFTLSQALQHGPVILQKSEQGSRHLLLALAYLQNASLAENMKFKADTVWTLKNHLNTHFDIQKILIGNDHQRMEINQLRGNVHFEPLTKRFKTDLTLLSGALYENNPEKVGNNIVDLVKVMELDNFSLAMDIHKIKNVWYGERHFSAGKITVFPYGAAEVLTLDNLTANLNQTHHADLTDFELSNQIEQINNGQFKINQWQLALALKNMNTSLLQDFAQAFLYSSGFQRLKLYSLLIDMFEKGMRVDLNQLQFNTDQGPVAMAAQINSSTANISSLNFLHFFENLNVQANAQVPKEWLKKNLTNYYENKRSENPQLKFNPEWVAGQYIDHWISHHLLVAKAGQVSMDVNYQEGRLLINGEKPALNNFFVNDVISNIR